MQLLPYTRTFLLPLLAVGLVLTGCDSTGVSDGDDDGDDDAIPLTTQTARNLLNADIKSQTDGLAEDGASEVSEDELLTRYNGDTDGVPILIADRVGSPAQNAYSGTTIESAVSTDALTGSAALEQGIDSPNSGSAPADELIRFYLGEVAGKSSGDELGSFDVYTTDNQIDMSQLVNKLLLGALEYKEGASALNDISGTSESDQDRLETAAEHFGAPDDFEPFLDYANGDEGLAGGTLGRDVNEDGQVDFNTEFVHTWAGYAAERSAQAENNGNPNDFARTFKSAIDDIRTAIENDDSSVDVAARASDALEAWEKVAAVNVIHYVNSMKSDLEEAGLALDEEVTVEALSNAGVREDYNEHWGEGKPFAWALQFNAQRNPDVDLPTLHEDLGAAPPYNSTREGTVTRQDVIDAVEAVKSRLESAYDFNSSNVDAW